MHHSFWPIHHSFWSMHHSFQLLAIPNQLLYYGSLAGVWPLANAMRQANCPVGRSSSHITLPAIHQPTLDITICKDSLKSAGEGRKIASIHSLTSAVVPVVCKRSLKDTCWCWNGRWYQWQLQNIRAGWLRTAFENFVTIVCPFVVTAGQLLQFPAQINAKIFVHFLNSVQF